MTSPERKALIEAVHELRNALLPANIKGPGVFDQSTLDRLNKLTYKLADVLVSIPEPQIMRPWVKDPKS